MKNLDPNEKENKPVENKSTYNILAAGNVLFVRSEIDSGGMRVFLTQHKKLADVFYSMGDAERFMARLKARYPKTDFSIASAQESNQ